MISALKDEGHTAYIAGGAVRDHLMGKRPKDYDVATSARPEEVMRIFRKKQQVGLAFGVVLVRDFGVATEVATFRCDGDYEDGRRPSSVSFADARSDAMRRDFTVNGLFYCPMRGEVLDYVEGLGDLEKRTIRAIGSPEKRFAEDHLRLLRALRFAVALDFSIEELTWQAVRGHAQLLSRIAPDRIHAELQLIFAAGNCDLAMDLLVSSGLCAAAFPGCRIPDFSPGGPCPSGGGLAAAVAIVLRGAAPGTDLAEYLDGLRFTKEERRDVDRLLRLDRKADSYPQLAMAEKKRMLREVPEAQLLYFLSRCGCPAGLLEEIEKDFARWRDGKLDPGPILSADDLMKAGMRPGPMVGRCLKHLEELALSEDILTREDAWARLAAHPVFGPKIQR